MRASIVGDSVTVSPTEKAVDEEHWSETFECDQWIEYMARREISVAIIDDNTVQIDMRKFVHRMRYEGLPEPLLEEETDRMKEQTEERCARQLTTVVVNTEVDAETIAEFEASMFHPPKMGPVSKSFCDEWMKNMTKHNIATPIDDKMVQIKTEEAVQMIKNENKENKEALTTDAMKELLDWIKRTTRMCARCINCCIDGEYCPSDDRAIATKEGND